MGLIQTESVSIHFIRYLTIMKEIIGSPQPYFQPNPPAPAPFRINPTYKDPITNRPSAWGLWVEDSHEIVVFGMFHFRPKSTSLLKNFSQAQDYTHSFR
jgi:hypothetical protein